MPFEGQAEPQLNKKPQSKAPTQEKSSIGPPQGGRRQINQPTGKLTTTNVGIKDTLNPRQKKTAAGGQTVNASLAEDFTFEELEYVWKEYSLGAKRDRKDSLYSTLMGSEMTMSSDYQVHLKIVNSVQAAEIEREKAEILAFIRAKLKNYNIGLKYTIETEQKKKVQIMDSKGAFEKLAEENSSLNKFRKLFNLDIEF